MKGVIIYIGKYGATQQYAKWIAEETGLNETASSSISGNELSRYDFLVIGSSVYIGQLQIKKWLHRNVPYIKKKKVFFFQVAGAPPEETEKREAYNEAGIPEEIAANFEHYFLPGKMNIYELSWRDRFMLKIGAALTKDPNAKKTMLANYNDVKKENVRQLVAAIRAITKKNEPAACQVKVPIG
jgi:menaquinone-dependent protoporphyrinogen IX oxidase